MGSQAADDNKTADQNRTADGTTPAAERKAGTRANQQRRPTRRDVAQRAGVSTATVSYVLNNTQKVPEKTAEKVWQAVRELNYKPDLIARSLVTKETKQLAIVLNNIANPIYADFILGFENKAINNGYFVNICTGNQHVDDYMENFAARRIDGILIEALPHKYHQEELYKLIAADIRIVVFGHTTMDLRKISSIETDYFDVMDQAVSHLANLGHSRIAYLSGLERSQTFDRRIDGYLKALESNGLTYGEELLVLPAHSTNTNISDGTKMARRLLDGKHQFTAVIATNDLMATGAMAAFKAAGLQIPRDVSVMGIDNAYIGEITEPGLTTLGISYRIVGERAFDLLYADIRDDVKGYYVNHAQLIERGSTGPAPTPASA